MLKAAKAMDLLGNREARVWVSMAKAMIPERVCQIIDQAIQIHGATGISYQTPLAELYADVRHLRFADGPDVFTYMVVGRDELGAPLQGYEGRGGRRSALTPHPPGACSLHAATDQLSR